MLQRTPLTKVQRVAMIRAMPCCVKGCWRWPVQTLYVRTAAATGATSSTDLIVPMCGYHAKLGSRIKWAAFQRRYNLDLMAIAAQLAQADGPADTRNGQQDAA